MTEPREYQRFLQAEQGRRLKDTFDLLPPPPTRATLWTQSSWLAASALLPLGLWVWGFLDPLDVVLLYFAEGTSYCIGVAARILVTAAPDPGARPRAVTALLYLLRHGVIWSALALATLFCLAPITPGTSIVQWVVTALVRFREPSMWVPAVVIALTFARDVARRSDYVDAYLAKGPREVARYGYVYPMALTFLLVTAGLLSAAFGGAGATDPPIAPVFFAAWLLGWRLAMQLLNLTLPIWGRAIGGGVDAMTDSLERGRSAGTQGE